MSTEEGHSLSSAPRAAFAAVLFLGWAILTVIWVSSTIDLAADGESSAVISAVLSLALLTLLAGMEGLEVAVIDRWRVLYPERTTSQLAAWLAARQLFVALIVTTATILSHRSELTIPFTSETISGDDSAEVVRHRMDRVHCAVVRADPPEAHGRDQPRPVPGVPPSASVPGCRRRAQNRRLDASGVGCEGG